MPRRATAPLAVLAVLALLAPAPASARLPPDFFGIAPQTAMGLADTNRMRQGGLEIVKLPIAWSAVQPRPNSGYQWGGVDQVIATIARAHLDVLPVLSTTPRWLAGRETNLPVASPRQRREWATFVRAAVERYGTRGEFWLEHSATSGDFVPRKPVRTWQIWNEENFFYFTTPASPARFARLLRISRRPIRQADGHAKVIIGGLFGNPKERPPRAMDAVDYLRRLYRVRGVKAAFDGVALHPYAADVEELRNLTESMRTVMLENHDRRTGLYITEMGWGSQHDPKRVSFEVGRHQQARELRRAYRYLVGNRKRLNLKQVHWFTWKDVRGNCDFCDSTGLFREGPRFKPKPAWHALVAIARGRR